MNLDQIGAIGYPSDRTASALTVLAHGAGAGQKHPFMIATARGLASRGMDVVTFDFPYMAQKRRAPDRARVLEQAFRELVDAARQWSRARRLFIGGKSMGGRIATHLAAQQLEGLDGVFALGYPLHPPGKPEQLRVAHLPDIVAPVLIVQGERDTFGTPSELEPVIAAMKAPVTLHAVAGGDHSLGVRGKKGAGPSDAVLDVIAGWIRRNAST
jgi:predicted alpha/beta-hydrolase family hydrolase